MYVYLLSEYGEHGAEDPVVTLNRDLLPVLLEKHWGYWKEQACPALCELLKKPDSELVSSEGHNLLKGWGGPQLHVIILTEKII